MDSVKNKRGRPRIIKSPAEFTRLADAYFERCEAEGEPVLLLGLVLALGLSSKQRLYEYRDRPEFTDVVRRALSRVEMEYEKTLRTGSATGPIFALKNFGWQDRSSFEHSGPGGAPVSLDVGISPTVERALAALRERQK